MSCGLRRRAGVAGQPGEQQKQREQRRCDPGRPRAPGVAAPVEQTASAADGGAPASPTGSAARRGTAGARCSSRLRTRSSRSPRSARFMKRCRSPGSDSAASAISRVASTHDLRPLLLLAEQEALEVGLDDVGRVHLRIERRADAQQQQQRPLEQDPLLGDVERVAQLAQADVHLAQVEQARPASCRPRT